MSDLQCPATFVVVGPGRPAPGEDPAEPVAAVYVAPGRRCEVRPGQARVSTGRAGVGDDARVAAPDVSEASDLGADPLWSVLEDLADLHRGCRVVVLPDRVEPPLAMADDVLIVRIDADGATVTRT